FFVPSKPPIQAHIPSNTRGSLAPWPSSSSPTDDQTGHIHAASGQNTASIQRERKNASQLN
ncbi:hypothetical protein, partial [Gallaecimonas pentaromativorans]|uniref:hypothetical protein n=1 Tax=Gallaecimonas pentaromativorans TaxID=584787 RepID=UPI001E32C0DC